VDNAPPDQKGITHCVVPFLFCIAAGKHKKISAHCRNLRETGCFVREWQTTEGGTCAII
jgi:hypothetical protein